jgi:hypothetical protein
MNSPVGVEPSISHISHTARGPPQGPTVTRSPVRPVTRAGPLPCGPRSNFRPAVLLPCTTFFRAGRDDIDSQVDGSSAAQFGKTAASAPTATLAVNHRWIVCLKKSQNSKTFIQIFVQADAQYWATLSQLSTVWSSNSVLLSQDSTTSSSASHGECSSPSGRPWPSFPVLRWCCGGSPYAPLFCVCSSIVAV